MSEVEAKRSEYIELLRIGPFPGRIDPWAEDAHYFHQLHGQMIGIMVAELGEVLIERGYTLSREVSLQILDKQDPDLAIMKPAERHEPQAKRPSWNYTEAAESVKAEIGSALASREVELDAIYIQHNRTLVTIIEVISPSNKAKFDIMEKYLQRRDQLMQENVNVVELDLTRSAKRLIEDPLVRMYAYHIAIHLHDNVSRLIGIHYGTPLKRIAIPLRRQVIGLDMQPIYDRAYQEAIIASQLRFADAYKTDQLPFPSLLTEIQQQEVLKAVRNWLNKLNELRGENTPD